MDTQPDFNELCKVGHRQDRMMEAATLSDIGGGQLSFTDKVFSVKAGKL